MANHGLIITLVVLFGILAASIVALLGAAWYIEHLQIMDAKPAFDPLVPLEVAVYRDTLPFYRQANYIGEFSAHSKLSDDNVSVLTCLNTLPEGNRLDLFIETPKVTDVSVPLLKAVRNLAFLDVTKTSISDRGIMELKESLPKTNVVQRKEPMTDPSPTQPP